MKKTNKILYLLIFLIFVVAGCSKNSNPAGTNIDCVIKYAVSGISDTVKHYSFTFTTPQSKKVEIQYLLVRGTNGDIKTAFNACDVCYPQHKGYSQVKTELRCNNCGNRYQIDGLGSQGKGGCLPGHLPHTIEGDSIVINISELVKGLYYFE